MLMKPALPRLLSPEILDDLEENDPRAVRSRRDLKLINRIMGSAGILARAMTATAAAPARIIELGAGDGELMLRLAHRLSSRWPQVHVVLLDCKNLVAEETIDGFARLGWTAETLQIDIEDWIAQAGQEQFDIAMANLFIHHFDSRQIGRLFDALSRHAGMFVACEPRRARLPLLASRMVGLLGANEVTRTDAVLSVKAGFDGRELSDLWPSAASDWALSERQAGLFSHLFIARRGR